MGSAGLEWDSNDQPEKARLNQKTRFVGTTAQISGLSTTYAGQEAFDTDLDTLYVRNAANSAWNEVHGITDNITETSESSTTPITDDGGIFAVAGKRYYQIITLPTTEPLYYITGIEWKNGTAVAGNVTAGVDVVDSTTPTNAGSPLLCLAQEVAQAGTSAVQRVSINSSNLIRGGTVIGVWVSFSSASATIREDNGSANAYEKATSYDATPPASDTTAWTSGVDQVYIKLYYRGYY